MQQEAALKEPGGFWLTNALVDRHARALGPNAIYVYLFLVRCPTQSHYPTLEDLGELTGLTHAKLQVAIEKLYKTKLLNDSDYDRLCPITTLPLEQ